MNANPAANIVLVHGGFVDGSGWRPLYDLLTQDGYHVAVVQNPTLSLWLPGQLAGREEAPLLHGIRSPPSVLAAQIAQVIASMALAALGLSEASVHEAVHGRGGQIPLSYYCA